ncbi:hypothetical protein N9426_01250 [Flavobacteriaceae bacterium]|nr:hypothetical protein [Flavobacteriaceae bacterium]MDC1056919.1 hypothetical protein [Flavobacteriaceae bacterium]
MEKLVKFEKGATFIAGAISVSPILCSGLSLNAKGAKRFKPLIVLDRYSI